MATCAWRARARAGACARAAPPPPRPPPHPPLLHSHLTPPAPGSYEGTFYEGARQGEGRCLYADGTVYSGAWAAGVRSGLGECVLPSGDSYYGMWEAGERHGQGAYVYRAKGRIYEGEWVRGVPRAGEVRDFAAAGADDAEGGSGSGSGSGSAALSARLQAPLPPLQLLDPQGVLRGACLAASGRLGGAGEGGGGGGGGGAAGDEGGSGGRAGTRGSAETYYSEGFSEGLSGSYASGSRPGTADAGAAGGGGGGGGAGGALDIDPGLTRENLEVLAAAFTAVDVRNTGFIPADAGALAYILHQLSIETPSEQDLAGLLEELVAQTQAMGGGDGLVSFHAFVAAMGKVKE